MYESVSEETDFIQCGSRNERADVKYITYVPRTKILPQGVKV